MNRNEILSATDEQLNQWAAEKVMGWELAWDGVRHVWVCGNTEREYETNYIPVGNIEQALALLDHLRDTQGYEWELSTLAKDKPYMATVWWDGFCQFVYREDDSRTRAIVIAALWAVARKGEG